MWSVFWYCSGKSESMSVEQMVKKITTMETELSEMQGKVDHMRAVKAALAFQTYRRDPMTKAGNPGSKWAKLVATVRSGGLNDR
jgi:hypothetical protein